MVKIYGEAKTGTTYLEHLIKANSDIGVYTSEKSWKHGFPEPHEGNTIILMRDVFDWCKSMKVQTIDKRYRGLEAKFGNTADKYIDIWKNWDNLIQCRTAKYHSYIGFWSLHKNVWLLNYRTLRDYPKVLKTILGIDIVNDIENHTYLKVNGKDNPDRVDLTYYERNFIHKHMDVKLERFVNSLIVK